MVVAWLDQIVNIRWIMEKAREFQKNIYFCFIDYARAFTVWIRINCGKFWKRWAYQTTWPASWETCMQVRKQQLDWTWNRLVPNRKRSTSRLYIVILFINLYAEYILRNAGLEEAQAGFKIARRNINNLRYADDTILMAESEEELKASWWKWKRRVKKLA